MASNKNAQNSAPRDLKRTNCTINLPLVFTILVYIVSGESLKVFFVTKFRVFYHVYIYVSYGLKPKVENHLSQVHEK